MIEEICQHCGKAFLARVRRDRRHPGHFCSRGCVTAARTTKVTRRCQYCDAEFEVHQWKLKVNFGRFCSRPCAGKARPPELVTPRDPARDGDKQQARMRIAREVRRGALPRANTVPCVDCGHVWEAGGSRHEYDHHLGYDADDHDAVESVCSRCHKLRTRARVAFLNFARGWLACLHAMAGAASWERWVTREDAPEDDGLTDAF
jgi:hypothetical protein